MSTFGIEIPVVGVTFEGRQVVLRDVYRKNLVNQTLPDVSLVPEPENKYDKNAIAVVIDFDGPKKIGYIPKHNNSAVLHLMKDRVSKVFIKSIGESKSGDIGLSIRMEVIANAEAQR